ncbi:MAG TPA: WbqC family protein [bacterium]|nr:WbqC family protein [bacterium]
MILAAHQLHYLPWLRYFHKIASADTFVVLDDIQFNKNGWQNRNKIKTQQGEFLLTIPVLHSFQQLLSEVAIDKKISWQKKHWGTISNAYRKASCFKDHDVFFRQIYEKEWAKLNELNNEMLTYFVKFLGIRTKIVRSSELAVKGEASERLVNLCKELGADTYLTGSFAAGAYLDQAMFEKQKIEVKRHAFECPVYPQLYPEAGFIPELSIVDLLFNCGTKSLEVLMNSAPFNTKSASF